MLANTEISALYTCTHVNVSNIEKIKNLKMET